MRVNLPEFAWFISTSSTWSPLHSKYSLICWSTFLLNIFLLFPGLYSIDCDHLCWHFVDYDKLCCILLRNELYCHMACNCSFFSLNISLTLRASRSWVATARPWGLSPSPRAARSHSCSISCSARSHFASSSCLYGPGRELASLRPSAISPRIAAWPKHGERDREIQEYRREEECGVSVSVGH